MLAQLADTGSGFIREGIVCSQSQPHANHSNNNRQRRSTRNTELLWREYFKDPSLWWDNRTKKINPRSPDFKHKITKEPLWIDGWHNPPWVETELAKGPSSRPTRYHDKELSWTSEGQIKKTTDHERKQGNEFQQVGAYMSLLRTCTKQKDLFEGSNVHAEIVEKGLFGKDIYLDNALVSMYVKCGDLTKAEEVFDQLPVRDVVSWTALIAGYVKFGKGEEALACFESMKYEGIAPNEFTFVCVLKACSSLRDSEKGVEFHKQILIEGLLEKNIILGTTLVDMYAKLGDVDKAQELFDELPVRDVISWSALIAGYAQCGRGEKALRCFEMMTSEGLVPNAATYVCILKACSSIAALDKGEEIHQKIIKTQMLEKNIVLSNALLDMYINCGAYVKVEELFNDIRSPNAVTWTTLISGYVQFGQNEKALTCFEQMQHKGIYPDAATYVCILKACGNIGAIDKGKKVHDDIVRQGLLIETAVGNALVDMYAKCGELGKAQEVLDALPSRNVITWTALMTGYAQVGDHATVCDLFDKMIGEHVWPNLVTFNVVLNSCSHSGMVDKGQMYFNSMQLQYGLIPTVEHYTCMVDLFSRAGYFDEAVRTIESLSNSDHLPLWTTLLGSCQEWGNVELARWAFENAIRVDPKDATSYICMSNVYAAASMQEDAEEIEAMRVRNEAWKS